MSLSSLYRRHAEICEQMASAAKTEEARQQWNDLAAELRHKADVQEGLIAVTPPAEAKLEEVPASKGSAVERSEPEGPTHVEPPSLLLTKDLGAEPEVRPSEPAAVSVFKEAPPSELGDAERTDHIAREEKPANEEEMLPIEHQPIQTGQATPEEVGTVDLEWEALLANIRSSKRPNKRD